MKLFHSQSEASIQWFLKLTLATKRNTPCERVWKTLSENGVFSTILFEVTWAFWKMWHASQILHWHFWFTLQQVVKKNVIDTIIPIVISLKHKLQAMKSGLLDDLMNFLRELMKDYKHDVNEMLASDKQLATEINYDLKKWEEEQAEVRRQQEEERVRNFDFKPF